MQSFIPSLLAALPSLARVQAYPSNRSHPLPLNNKTLIPLVVEGGACGYEPNENDAICGHGLCCNIETGLCGSDDLSCSAINCLPRYSTGCEWQGKINADLQVKDPLLNHYSPDQASSSSVQKRQDAAAQAVDANTSSDEGLYKRPSLSWLVSLPRQKLGSVPYGELITTCTEPGTIALTFDDGPWKYTEDLLDILRNYGVQATFFVCGGNMGGDGQITDYGHPHLLQRMVNEEHQVATHTWAHADLTTVDEHGILDQLLFNEQALVEALGKIPTYFRPPYFSSNEEVLDTVGQLGYHVINAGVDTNDWKGDYEAAKQTFSQALQQGQWDGTGKIVLAHDIHERTVHELAGYMIEQALNAGYRLVTVGECLGDPEQNWYRNPRTGGSWTSRDPANSELVQRSMTPSAGQSKEFLESLKSQQPPASTEHHHGVQLAAGHAPPLMSIPTATEKHNTLITRAAEPSDPVAADVARYEMEGRFDAPQWAATNAEEILEVSGAAEPPSAGGSRFSRANLGLVLALIDLFILLR
ncbi:hypothetical protein N8I77_001580 [Diaporthe amygdali]|uniref:NodB homology domain-containing protein n=1 Tax=Phomopsis amygdali TaxID=1214568 RepID=A0AAD9W9J1_PHOAM|nr:hypothetical protein N8I77_001580 [Diaporthe amygdali]